MKINSTREMVMPYDHMKSLLNMMECQGNRLTNLPEDKRVNNINYEIKSSG